MSGPPKENASKIFRILAITALTFAAACGSSDETPARNDVVTPSDGDDIDDTEDDTDSGTTDTLPGGDADSTEGAVAITILAINDFHGHLEPPAGGLGVDRGDAGWRRRASRRSHQGSSRGEPAQHPGVRGRPHRR